MTSRSGADWDIGAIPLAAPEAMGGIVAALADLALVVSAGGRVRSVVANRVGGGGVEPARWRHGDLRDALTVESVPKFERALAQAAAGAPPRPVELNHLDLVERVELPIAYTFHPLGGEAGILMLGRDLRPVSEMQQQLVNAQMALERDHEAQRDYDTRFRVLMASTRDAMVLVSVADGRILEANASAAALLSQGVGELTGQELARVFEDQGRGEFMADMAASALSEGGVSIDLAVRGSRRAIRAVPSFFRAAGSRMMLCRLEPRAEAALPADGVEEAMAALFRAGPEAIVILDRAGDVVAANDAFLDLTESAHATAVQGRPVSDFLARGVVDMRILLENATRSGRMRVYATRLLGQFRSQRPVEASITALGTGSERGYVLLMRDAAIGQAARALKGPAPGPDGSRSVIDLVGSASLREIVADTTEVIEKLCIEAAVELTSNNRVAAAEMLGLSRQSLYVKLRKYGLLARSDAE